MAVTWKPLNLGTPADVHLPPLLISKSFRADSYEIHLTDLTHIWSEALDRAAILERADEETTSIDPSDSSQLQILLEKLALALSSAPSTTLSLHVPSSPGRARPTLSLNLTINLPGGLAPLQWPIHFSTAPPSVLTSQLTIPLLQAQYARIKEIDGLTESLREKDHVIQKLLDRLETQGTDLGQVFPQATARGGRKVDRKLAEEKVRGLGPFNIEAWRKGLDDHQAQDAAQLVESVFTGDSVLDLETKNLAGADNWWEAIKGLTIDLSKNKSAVTRTKKPSRPTLKQEESTKDSDYFQVQVTPPHLASTPKAFQTLDDSTDDDDLDGPSQISQTKSAKKFGKIGAKKDSPKNALQESDSTSDEEASASKPLKSFGRIGGKKATPSSAKDDLSDDDEREPPKSTKKPGKIGGRKPGPKEHSLPADNSTDDSEPIAPKSAKKLGRLGGKKARPSPPSAQDETTDDEVALPLMEGGSSESSSTEPAVKPKWGLGKIGGKKKMSSPSPSSSDADLKPGKGILGQIAEKKKKATPTLPRSQKEAPARRKLGAIGGRNKIAHEGNTSVRAGTEDSDGTDIGRGRSVKVEKEKIPPPRETSEERAEKKRRELKRQLEEKAKAPVKKKRKF